jgi:hypothetical protein
MDPATLSALAALGGAAVGGVTSLSTTWLTQKAQAKLQELAHKRDRREDLYKEFIEEASKLYADALVHNISDISKLVDLYALINMMHVISPRNTFEAAEKVGRTIVSTYLAPDKAVPELEQMMNRGEIDVLEKFSEAARQEFHHLGW